MKFILALVASLALGVTVGADVVTFRDHARIMELEQNQTALVLVLDSHRRALEVLVRRTQEQSL